MGSAPYPYLAQTQAVNVGLRPATFTDVIFTVSSTISPTFSLPRPFSRRLLRQWRSELSSSSSDDDESSKHSFYNFVEHNSTTTTSPTCKERFKASSNSISKTGFQLSFDPSNVVRRSPSLFAVIHDKVNLLKRDSGHGSHPFPLFVPHNGTCPGSWFLHTVCDAYAISSPQGINVDVDVDIHVPLGIKYFLSSLQMCHPNPQCI